MKNRLALKRSINRRFILTLCFTLVLTSFSPIGLLAQDYGGQKPNYELASKWTSQKVGKLVFDTSVTPRWLETGDRFWYSYQTSQGRSFYLVDPARKSKTLLFDNGKMASQLTTITRIPYDAQHIPMTTLRFIKKDTAFQFDLNVPRDADIAGAKPPDQTDEQGQGQGRGQGQRGQGQRGQGQRGQGPGQAPPPAGTKTIYFEYDLATAKLTLLTDYKPPARRPTWASISPDEKTILFARSHNLFMMDAENFEKAKKNQNDATIVETQLTTDGEEHYSFGAGRGGGGGDQQQQQQDDQQQQQQQQQNTQTEGKDQKPPRTAPANIIWSRDSRKFSLVRRDQRKVGDLWVIDALASPRPKLETYRYAMPGEENITLSEIIVFDRDSKARVPIKVERFKDQTIQIPTGRISTRGLDPERPAPPPQWLSETSDKLYFTRLSRDMHKFDVCVANPETGEVKALIEERLNVYIESKPLRLVNNGQDLLFWSERDGWGHYYLYDANTGALKNPVTSGEYVADAIQGVDEKTRAIYFTANGHENGEDPYFSHLYRINLDGSALKLLNTGDATHAVNVAESNKYFVDNSSKIDCPPKSMLYDGAGNAVLELETPDLSALMEAGFKYPEPFKVKADDGITDLYGVMYKPFDFDPKKKYPVIAYVYPGPQTESVTKTFSPRNERVALAQFGFIMIEVGNRGGNPQRSKWYHSYGYGNLRDYGLADKKAAIEQLAKRHSFIDIDRVGIWGHSGGGFMSAAAMLVYPDFFKVAFSESGNHENNIYNNTWSEKHHGVKEVTDKDGKVTFEYNIEKNSEIAKNLKGHLMLTTGDIDNNVHPANTYRLADALIKANKRFDMLVIPGKRHGYADAGDYVFWVRADYFCRYLLGDAATSIDMIELNREKEQSGDKGKRPPTPPGR